MSEAAPMLFDDPAAELAARLKNAPSPAVVGPFAGIALEQSIDRVLDYRVPARLVASLRPGQRVRVPLGRGNKSTSGYVIDIRPTTAFVRPEKIKPIADIADDRVLVPPRLMELSRWISRYYVCPLGVVLESVIPAAVKKRIGMGYRRMVRLAMTREAAQQLIEQTKAKKRRSILARLLQVAEDGAIELNVLAGESGTTPATVKKLARAGVVHITAEPDLPSFAIGPAADPDRHAEPAGDLPANVDQQVALEQLLPRVSAGGFSVNLLLGVTGSGKTEVYLRCIRAAIEAGRQAIVLVPEIALTPQTVRRFVARFPNVAVLHSGLSATQRHRFWQQIASGQANVVVGARSAIFAPLPRLGVIVVDEEHESSYKQDQAPRYHARDVAIKRGQIEGVPVILGSATPALETYWNATRPTSSQAIFPPPSGRGQGEGERRLPFGGVTRGSATHFGDRPHPNPLPAGEGTGAGRGITAFHLLRLPVRVRGLQLPHVEVVDMRNEARLRRGVHLISVRLEHLLKATLQAGRQAILLLNRRGYSNFVYCPSCANVIQCKYCDTTMTYHRSAGANAHNATSQEGIHTGQLHCHYCLAVNPLPERCPVCSKKLSLFGLGTQRVEEEIARKFPDLKFARVDSDSMHGVKDYEALLGRFANREVQVLLGTQMIAKGLDFPNVTLVGVVSGDTALSLPDFRASERTFQLITQVAGRAGRGDDPGRVVLQTFQPDDPTIRAAVKQDYDGFAKNELQSRREVGLPPFARMVRIIIRDQDVNVLNDACLRLSDGLHTAIATLPAADADAIKMKGPMPCAISRIAGYYRNQIVLTSDQPNRLQRVLATMRAAGDFKKADRIAVDVDPVSLL